MEWLIPIGMILMLLQKDPSLASENESPRIQSFTFEERSEADNQWASTTDTQKGKHIRLVCTIDSPSSENFTIRKLDESNALQPLEYPNPRQIVHEFRNLTCNDFGVYVCEDGLGTSQIAELGIFNCAPRLCDEGDTVLKKTSAVAINEALTFDVCVQGYPEIGVEILATASIPESSTETEVDASHVRKSHVTTKELIDHNDWKHDVEPVPNTFGAYTVNITKSSISEDDYGEIKFAIFTIHEGHRKQLIYTVILEPVAKGPPACPTDLEATKTESDSVQLSWQPGFNGGSIQVFQVYILNEEEKWVPVGGTAWETSKSITDLHADTQYIFRVISANNVLRNPGGDRCNNTLEVKTAKLAKAAEEATIHAALIFGVVVAGLFFIATVIILTVLVYNYIKSYQTATAVYVLASDVET